MPAWNAGPFLRQAVESILSQTLGDWELIVVDDGSTDDTPAVLAELAARDARLRVLTNESNLGIVAALNRGLDACRGQYVARMDADDVALGERLARQVAELDSRGELVALGGAVAYIDADGRDLGVVRRCAVGGSPLRANPLLHPTVVIRREVLEAGHLRYRPELRHAEDYYLWLELSRHGRLGALDEVVVKYRITAAAARMRHARGMLWATLRVKARAVRRLRIVPTLGDVLRFAAECLLLAAPSGVIRWLYLRRMFAGRRPALEARRAKR